MEQTQHEALSVDVDVTNNEPVDAGPMNPFPVDVKQPPTLPSDWRNDVNLAEINATVSTESYLPEIGKIARDLIRGSDEKLGIAVAAYNSASLYP